MCGAVGERERPGAGAPEDTGEAKWIGPEWQLAHLVPLAASVREEARLAGLATADQLRDAVQAVLEGMAAGLEAARPGRRCEDIARAFFGVLAKYGIEKDNRTGYSIGLSYPPDWGERTMSLRSGDRTLLELASANNLSSILIAARERKFKADRG